MTGRTRLDRARRLLDAPPPAPVPGQLPFERPQQTCDTGSPRCHGTPARPYPCGWRCEEHKPVPRPRPEATL